MAVSVVDFTKNPERTFFSGSSEEDTVCAKTFWQSVTLLPPMESRLVSSDIKQRLRTAPAGGSHQRNGTGNSTYRVPVNDLAVQEFLNKAKNMQKMEEFLRLREFASARDEDRELLHRRRNERKKKEEISRNKINRKDTTEDKLKVVLSDEEDIDEDINKVMKDLDEFDKLKNQKDEDSD